jgi:uncharacterized phage protein (TIGR02216 family)
MSEGLFPWDFAMRFGFGVLRLSSKEFWALSPKELAAAMAAHGGVGSAAPARSSLAELMKRFPDEVKHGR